MEVDNTAIRAFPTASQAPENALEGRFRDVGTALGQSLSALLEALPGAPSRPSQLVDELGVNRAVASRLLKAVSKRDPLEVLHVIPGPEPLRKVARAASGLGAPVVLVESVHRAVRDFDLLIRDEAGTRPALDALISSSLPGARGKLELSSKYSVFKGMSQLRGVQGELWLGTAVVAPSATDAERHDLTWLNGAVAMQRMRPGVTVRFGYRYRSNLQSADDSEQEGDELPGPSVTSLDQFCVNAPAQLEARQAGKAIHYTLPDDLLGPKQVADMFVVDHHPSAMRRFRAEAGEPGDSDRRRNSLFIEPAFPVANLVFDVILHDEAFPGSEPELLIYDTGYDGIANVNDAERDIDRMDVRETVEFLGHDLSRIQTTELASYSPMLMHLAEVFDWDPSRFRGYRTRIQYPVYGWQVCLSFDPPARPSK